MCIFSIEIYVFVGTVCNFSTVINVVEDCCCKLRISPVKLNKEDSLGLVFLCWVFPGALPRNSMCQMW
jgi:hypothetical protein